MKILKYLFSLSVVLLALTTCSDDQKDINFSTSVEAPSELAMLFQVTQDNTGLVSITPTAQGAVEFDIHFGDDTSDPVNFTNGQSATHTYVEGTYTVTAVAYGVTGLETTLEQELVVSFQAPSNLEVVIENDSAISKRVNVTASADFAVSFDVTAPGTTEETPSPATGNNGDTVVIDFTVPGTYTITVEVMGAAIETTVYTEDFEVTAIEAPVASAPTPPSRADEDVISIFSSVYSDLPGTNYFPDWGQGGQGSGWNMFDLAGDEMLQYVNLSYQGISLADGTSVDVSTMEYLHLDVWTADAVTDIETSLINGADGASTETPIVTSLSANNWTSIDIPVSAYTDLGQVVNSIFQLKFVGTPWAAGTVFIDNIYFYKESTNTGAFDDGLLTNGDFENGSEAWLVGVDPASAAPVVTGADGNQYYSFNVTNAGNPWEVNTSQFVELINGATYTLMFDAWSDVNRPILAGIGLSGAPWSNVVETVDITPTRTTYSYTFEAIGFGDPQGRVLFDLGAAVGEVNLDNVALYLGDGPPIGFDDGLLTNGDFQNGSEAWLVGVDPASAAPVATDADGNTFYYVNVENAGNPWEVNTSQIVELVSGGTYTLTFDAASNTNRPILAGIGLSAAPWDNVTETAEISPTVTTFSYTFESIGFGSTEGRVLFDLGAATGEVYIDNVSLFLN